MKFGLNMLLWTGDPTGETYLPLFEKIKKMGYDGVELPIFNLNPDRFAALGKQLDKIGLERTGTLVRSAEDDPMSPDPAVRKKGVDANKRGVDCAEAAGIKVVAGPFHSGIGVFSGKDATKEEFNRAVESMREASEYAGKHGVTFALEFLNRFECYLLTCAENMVTFVNAVNHPNCRAMWDTFHSHIEEKDMAASIRCINPVLAHVHISENDRSTPGQGQVHWKEVFDTLKEVGYDKWMTVEAFSQAIPELVAATKIWRRMYKDEETLAKDALAFMKAEVAKRG